MSVVVQHPMIDVADAIHIVLKETARMLLEKQQSSSSSLSEHEVEKYGRQHNYETIHLYNDDTKNDLTLLDSLLGRVIYDDVYMSHPHGYPPYPTSIMDGYAINTQQNFSPIPRSRKEKSNTNNVDVASSQQYTHTVLRKVFAGDEPNINSLNGTTKVAAEATNTNDHQTKQVAATTTGNVRGGVEEREISMESQKLPYAYYVATGSLIPESCDCVVPIEDVSVLNEKDDDSQHQKIIIYNDAIIAKNQWIRIPGSDIASGTKIVTAGTIIDPIVIGLLLQSGAVCISVWKQLVIGILSTGNELYDQSSISSSSEKRIARSGMIPDVNRPMIINLLRSWYGSVGSIFTIVDLGIVRDDINQMTQVLQSATEQCEIIITSAGVSRGDLDVVEFVLTKKLQGKFHFGRLNMKPGKPTTFVTVQQPLTSVTGQGRHLWKTTLVFAMPGNPCSALVCTNLLIQPCLDMTNNYYYSSIMNTSWSSDDSISTKSTNNFVPIRQQQLQHDEEDQVMKMMIQCAVAHPECMAMLMCDIKLDFERPEYHRVNIMKKRKSKIQQQLSIKENCCDTGSTTTVQDFYYYEAHSTGMQRSSRLASMLHANGLIVLPKGTKENPIALRGELYLVLKLRSPTFSYPIIRQDNDDISCCIPVRSSQHLKFTNISKPVVTQNVYLSDEVFKGHEHGTSADGTTTINVGIVNICSNTSRDSTTSVPSTTSMKQILSNQFNVYSNVVFDFNRPMHELLPFIDEECTHKKSTKPQADVIVIVSPMDSTILYHATVANYLRHHKGVSKINDSIGQLARRTYSVQNPTLALYECIVGLYDVSMSTTNSSLSPSLQSATQIMIIFLPFHGLHIALTQIRDLLRVAVIMSKG
jgi:molybdenum cofactor synthesis domain-containing protein